MSKLTEFAQAVGRDIKNLLDRFTTADGKIDTLERSVESLQSAQQNGLKMSEVETKINEKVGELRTQLLGGDVDAALDTFAEIAEKLKGLDGSVGAAITEKLAEIRQDLTACKAVVEENLVATYTTAKS